MNNEQIGTNEQIPELEITNAGAEIATALEATRDQVENLHDKISRKMPELNDDAVVPFLADVQEASAKFLDKTSITKVKAQRVSRKRYDPQKSEGWVTLRFRITESQRDVVMNAMERSREIADIKGKIWKGLALEWVCADFLAGHGEAGEGADTGGYVADDKRGNILAGFVPMVIK